MSENDRGEREHGRRTSGGVEVTDALIERLAAQAEQGYDLDKVPRRRRCEAHARKGTGTGMCDRRLDRHGCCDRAGDHLDD